LATGWRTVKGLSCFVGAIKRDQTRDKQLDLVDSSTETGAIKKYWRTYHQKHYDKLLRTIVKLAKRRKQSAKPAAKGR
jgi:hypothetical protein